MELHEDILEESSQLGVMDLCASCFPMMEGFWWG